MWLYDSMQHRMLPINFNKNINKMFNFGTVRFEFGNIQYELYESTRESMYFSVLFIVCTHLKIIFDKNFEKNLKKKCEVILEFFWQKSQ